MMKKLMVLATAVGTTMAVFGVGVASAEPDFTGKKYSEALDAMQSWGITARVSARVGDRLADGDCIVTSHTKSATPARGFTKEQTSIVLVALDCNGVPASATQPGYSAASPEARAAVKEQEKLEWLATDQGQEYCESAERMHPDWAPIEGCHLEE